MKEKTREEPEILAAAERQMQAWAMKQQIAERAVTGDQPEKPVPEVGSYIAISREAGTGGAEIAQLIGRQLGWEVLDKSLVEKVADKGHLSRSGLHAVDETRTNWAYDVLGAWLDHRTVSSGKFVNHLTRVLAAAARGGNLVVVGRGAQFVLPREKGLAVRIIASDKYRVEELMRRNDLNESAARKMMADLERGRREFVRDVFHRDVDDPHLYDLVINVERFGAEGTASRIVAALGG